LADVVGEGKAVLTADTSEHDAALAKASKVAEREAQKAQKAQERAQAAAEKAAVKAAATAEREAVKATKAAEREAAKQAKAAERAAATAAREFETGFNKIKQSAASAFSQIGGQFGTLGGVVFDVLEPLSEVSGGLVAIGAGAAVVAGVGYAMYSLGGAAAAATKELQELGFTVDRRALKDLAAYTDGQAHLTTEIDKVTSALGGPLAEEIGIVDQAVATSLQWMAKWAGQISDTAENITGIRGELDKLAKAVGNDPVLAANKAAYIEMVNQQIALEPVLAKELEENTKRVLDRGKAEQAGIGIAQDHQRATAAWALADMEATAAQVAAADKQIMAIRETESERERSYAAAKRTMDDFVSSTQRGLDQLTVATDDAVRDLGQTWKDYYRDRLRAEAHFADGVIGSIGDIAQADVDMVQARLDAGEKLSAGTLRQANLALEVAEAAAISQAGIAATLVGIETYAALIPFLTPFGAAVAGSIAGSLSFGAAVAGIEVHRPPNFEAPGRQGHQDPGVNHVQNEDGGSATDTTTGSGGGKSQQNDALDVGDRSRRGTTDRSSHGATLGLSPEASRLFRELRRAGKRDHRGRL